MTKKTIAIENAADFATYFPKIGSLLNALDVTPLETAKAFPHLLTTIENTWGTASCLSYMKQLLFSDRPNRQGFPSKVADEINIIKNAFEVAFPHLMLSPNDPYSDVHAAELQAMVNRQVEQAQKNKEAALAAQAEQTAVAAPRNLPVEISTLEALQTALAAIDQESASRPDRRMIGEYLIEAGALTSDNLEKMLVRQRQAAIRHPLGKMLIDDGLVASWQVNRALSQQSGIPIVDLESIGSAFDALRLVPVHTAKRKAAIPITLYDNRLVVATSNPFDRDLLEYFSFLSGTRAILVYATPHRIAAALKSYGRNHAGKAPAADSAQLESSPPPNDKESHRDSASGSVAPNETTAIELIDHAIGDAIRAHASDIHFEAFPQRRHARIRWRKDGALETHSEYPLAYHAAVMTRLKTLATLDLAQNRIAQEGRIGCVHDGVRRDLRIAIIPTSQDLETATLRMVKSSAPTPLADLGMHPLTLNALHEHIDQPDGLILVCGPSDSGKTTTLHALLHELASPQRKLWSAEDPVEIVQNDICQVQVQPNSGWTFAAALRSFLHADPDVIMIGEIRDAETARATAEASMSGTLALSALATPTAADTLARLLDYGVPAYTLATAVRAILSQRLVRRICRECGESYEFGDEELAMLGNEYFLASDGTAPSDAERAALIEGWRREFANDGPLRGMRAMGCHRCRSGYHGRLGVHEALIMTSELRRLLRAGAASDEITRQAMIGGMKTLRQDAIEKVVQGLTDLAEIRRACR